MEFLNREQMHKKFGNNYIAWRDFLFSLPVNARDGYSGPELAQYRYMAGHALQVVKSNGKKAYNLFWLQNAQRLDARVEGELEGLPSRKHAGLFVEATMFIDWCAFDKDVEKRAWEWMHQGALLGVVGLQWIWCFPESRRIEGFWLMDEVVERLSNSLSKSTEVRHEVLRRMFADEAACVLHKYLLKLESEQLKSGPQRLHCAHVLSQSLDLTVSAAKVLVGIIASDLDHYRAVAKIRKEIALGATLVAMRDAAASASPDLLKKIGEDIGAALKETNT